MYVVLIGEKLKLIYILEQHFICSHRIVVLCLLQRLLEELKQSNIII